MQQGSAASACRRPLTCADALLVAQPQQRCAEHLVMGLLAIPMRMDGVRVT